MNDASGAFICPNLSRHAQARRQQRAVPTLAMSLLLDYGTRVQRGGAEVISMDKAGRRRLEQDWGGPRNLAALQPMLNTYLVLGPDGTIITTARRTKRLKRT